MKIFSLNKQEYTDEEIIKHIQNNTSQVDSCLKFLYKQNVTSIVKLITKNNGSEDEGKDVFQNAIITFYEKAREDNFKLTSKISTFLFSIAKNQWYNRLRKKGKMLALDTTEENFNADSTYGYDEELQKDKTAIILQIMNQLQEDCKKILLFTVFEKKNMDAVAKEMGYKNDQIARNKKSKCMSYLKKMVLESPQYASYLKAL